MIRIARVDIVRGMVMLLMVLDHVRDFFGSHHINALDLSKTNTALFLARWITHLCAPTFVFLAGCSIYLQSQNRTSSSLAWFLISRGFVLIVFEQTILRCFGWYFNFDYHFMNANVLWGIGGAMVLLSGFIYLPRAVVLVIGLILISGTDWLLQMVTISESQGGYWLWSMFLKGGNIEYLPNHYFYVSYPFLPWSGIMALGYGIGGYLLHEKPGKFKWHHGALLFISTFIVVRLFFSYGNPLPWQLQKDNWFTFLSFINLEKYPPSFLFSLITLSITFLLLSVAERLPLRIQAPLQLIGRVPLFFYTLHIVIIHALAVLVSWLRFGRAEWLYHGPVIFWDVALPGQPPSYGLSLTWVYLITVTVVIALYPVCQWFAEVKKKNDSVWLRYF